MYNAHVTFAVIIGLLAYGRELNTNGSENLLYNGSKAYYCGGGWWRIRGYSTKDIPEIKIAIGYLKKCGRPCSVCGKLTIAKKWPVKCKECS